MRHSALALVILASVASEGQIVLKPSGSDAIALNPRTVDVRATIRQGVSSDVWTYTFANAERFRGQADFLIAIPKGGVVQGFAYWYQGERVPAKIAEKERARRIYTAIVRRQRDPALIELVGKESFRVRIFPIDPEADLKVEIRIVRPLDGPTLTIPLHALGKLEKATVGFSSDTPVKTSWSGDPNRNAYEIANSASPDLRITQVWGPRALHASVLASRSGGPTGFFAATLTPSARLKNRRWRLEGAVEDVMEVKTGGDSVVLVGQYRKPGPVRAWLVGDGYRAYADLTMSDVVEPNGPAAKLWAWNRILASKDPKEIVALSLRHGVPSRLTSWIAIPTQERKRMAREIAQAELEHDVSRSLPALFRAGAGTLRGRAILDRMEATARARHLQLSELTLPTVQEQAERLKERWSKAVLREGERSSTSRRLQRDMEALGRLGANSDGVREFFAGRAESLAREVLEDRAANRRGPQAAARVAAFRRAAALSGWKDPRALETFLRSVADAPIQSAASEAVRAEREGRDAPAALERVRRLSRVIGADPEEWLRIWRIDAASTRLAGLNRTVALAVRTGQIDEANLAKDADARRREVAILKANGAKPYQYGTLFGMHARAFGWKVLRGEAKVEAADAIQKEDRRIADLAGIPIEPEWDVAWQEVDQNLSYQIATQELDARRDAAKLRELEEVRAQVRARMSVPPAPIQVSNVRNEPQWIERNAYVEARHRGEPATKELQVLAKVASSVRVQRLEALTELDELDRQTPDPQVLARKAELEKRATELRARMGDPIVRIDAPKARSVFARLPDGSRLTLHRAKDGRWEGRFDVPPGVKDGRYEIAVFVDGNLKATVPITVDTHAPTFAVHWDGGRAEVATDIDVRRVTGLTPDGRRLELTREAAGRFATLAPEGTRFVATDGAHNRSDAPSVLAGEGVASWAGGVTALARMGGRLWVGTANEGGGYEGETPDAERPWVKASVAVGGRLAVRYADGAVLLDGIPVRHSRDATAIAADGDALLVGTIGGFYDGDRAVFPPELAGVVVTALLGDGDRVWLGTQGRGLAEVDRKTGALRWHDERAGLGDDWITCLGRDGKGRVVAGTFVAGAYTLDGVWRQVPGTVGACVSGVGGDWVATRQGVFRGGRLVDPIEATALLDDGLTATVGTRSGPRVIKL